MNESGPARLLVVDDEARHLQALCDTLEDRGFEVVGCTDAAAALDALGRSTFDLLLADLRMPGMNGIELLRSALSFDPTLMCIIVTGEGSIDSAVEAMQAGAIDYIVKPFKQSAILPVIGRALEMRRLKRTNLELERRLREHAAELEATNRELQAFTHSASHDLRAPLNAVLGFATLLHDKVEAQLAPQQQGWLQGIERSAQQMSELIDALMRLSSAGRQALHLERVDVASLVQTVVEEQRLAHAPRRVSVQLGALPEAIADALLLRQVFTNLLSNAFKYTRDAAAPLVEVVHERHGDDDAYGVRDNGAGFDMARAAHLFEPFQRLHRPSEFEGSGIGLSIVQRIVQRHGGRLWALAAPGQGAAFYFTLPASPGQRQADPP